MGGRVDGTEVPVPDGIMLFQKLYYVRALVFVLW